MSLRARVVACAAGLLAGCGNGSGQDWLIASAQSRESRHVARLWCADYCDVPGRLVLTLSPADRAVGIVAGDAPFPPEGDLPDTDAVAVLRDGNAPDFPAASIAWTSSRSMTVSLPCPEADIGKPAPALLTARGIRIRIASSGPCLRQS